MPEFTDKATESPQKSLASRVGSSNTAPSFWTDNRPEIVAQRAFNKKVNQSAQERLQGSGIDNKIIQRTNGKENVAEAANIGVHRTEELDALLAEMDETLGSDRGSDAGQTQPFANTLKGLDALLAEVDEALGSDRKPDAGPTQAFSDTPTYQDKLFLANYTLIPGLKYSKVAQDLKFQSTQKDSALYGKYAELRKTYETKYQNKKEKFEGKFQSADKGAHPEKYPKNPEAAMESLNVMHPRNTLEGELIVELNDINTALNNELADTLESGNDIATNEYDKHVDKEGGIAEKHSAAFKKMLKFRGHNGPILIRPAGNASVEHLKANMPAKPLWIKGKSIDITILKSPVHKAALRQLFIEGGAPDDLSAVEILIEKLAAGYIPVEQGYSKWIRTAIKKLEILENSDGTVNFTKGQISKLKADLEDANRAIVEMQAAHLIGEMEQYGQKYVADPSTKKAYTGDYDLYAISHAGNDKKKVDEMNKLREKSRSNGTYKSEDLASINKKAYSPMMSMEDEEQKKPDVTHKLFGNISRYEMGMMIDLNAAAIKWGGYTAGQVIKHGAESRNLKYTQEILDGIVILDQELVAFMKDAKDDPTNKFYNEALMAIGGHLIKMLSELPDSGNELVKYKDYEIPINPKAIDKLKPLLDNLNKLMREFNPELIHLASPPDQEGAGKPRAPNTRPNSAVGDSKWKKEEQMNSRFMINVPDTDPPRPKNPTPYSHGQGTLPRRKRVEVQRSGGLDELDKLKMEIFGNRPPNPTPYTQPSTGAQEYDVRDQDEVDKLTLKIFGNRPPNPTPDSQHKRLDTAKAPDKRK